MATWPSAARSDIAVDRTIGIRELKNRLREIVRTVKGGEHVLVTDRGTVVAVLVPPGWTKPMPTIGMRD